jgi:hypothetical protein
MLRLLGDENFNHDIIGAYSEGPTWTSHECRTLACAARTAQRYSRGRPKTSVLS